MTVAVYIITALLIYLSVGFVVRKVLQGPDESTYMIVVI